MPFNRGKNVSGYHSLLASAELRTGWLGPDVWTAVGTSAVQLALVFHPQSGTVLGPFVNSENLLLQDQILVGNETGATDEQWNGKVVRQVLFRIFTSASPSKEEKV
jgi:hypothetical protein